MRYVYEYIIRMNGQKAEVSRHRPEFRDGEEESVSECSVLCDFEQILKLLNRCKVLSWDGFEGKRPKGILDGITFYLYGIVNDGRKIEARGSQRFPYRFYEFRDALYSMVKDAGRSDQK